MSTPTEVNYQLPGGAYTARENPDGSWDILDVPILGPVEPGVRQNVGAIGRGWFHAAIGSARRRLSEGYLAPLHVYHHDDQGTKRTIRAGFFLPKTVRVIRYEGQPTPVVSCDLKAIPPKIFEMIERGELPFRSVEIHDWDTPEINSLALLPDEVPFFRFELLTIGKKVHLAEKPGDEKARFFALEPGTRAVAVFRLENNEMAIRKIDPRTGKPVKLSGAEEEELNREDLQDSDDDEINLEDDEGDEADKMADAAPPPEEEEAPPAPPPAEGEVPPPAPEEAIPPAPAQEAPPAWAGAITQGMTALSQGMAKIIELLGGGGEQPAPQETAPAPAPAVPPAAFKAEAKGAGLAGENAALRSKERLRAKSDKTKSLIDDAIKGLTADGYDIDEEARAEISKFAATPALLSNFVKSFRMIAIQDPPETLEGLDGGATPRDCPEVMSFTNSSPEIMSLARQAGEAFDALGKRVGHMSKKRFIELEVARAAGP